MTIDAAIALLEARGVVLAIRQEDGLSLTFPIGYVRSAEDNKLLEILKANKDRALSCLLARKDAQNGFTKAEPSFDPITLQTYDINEAVAIGEAIRKGQAVLEGKVIYDPRIFMITICYRPLVPSEWLEISQSKS